VEVVCLAVDFSHTMGYLIFDNLRILRLFLTSFRDCIVRVTIYYEGRSIKKDRGLPLP
jgi:hypothetical protein